jgi:hypothetical protein
MCVDDFGSEFRKVVNISTGFANFGNKILTLDIPEFLQCAPEFLCLWAETDSPSEQKSNPIYLVLLRAGPLLRKRCKRPRDGAAERG